MTNYRAILLYHSKGNTTTQVATICECSRTTVLRTIKRAKELNLTIPVSSDITDEELYLMICPNKGRNPEYYYPDFNELDHDRKKRSFTKYRAWQKYCRVAERKGLKAYKKSRFYKLYYNFFHRLMTALRGKFGENLQEIRAFEIAGNKIIRRFGKESPAFDTIKMELVGWCKKRRLDPRKLLPI